MARARVRTAKLNKALVHLNETVKTTKERRGELQALLTERERRLEGSCPAATPGFMRAQQMGLTAMKGR